MTYCNSVSKYFDQNVQNFDMKGGGQYVFLQGMLHFILPDILTRSHKKEQQ